MSTIRLNNLINPRIVNSPNTNIEIEVFSNKPTYTDIHFDLQLEKTIGEGYNPKNSGDIKVDTDQEAIKNSIRNIFSTKKGEKILTPTFGASLEQYLFEMVDDFKGSIIGREILENLQTFEPRIDVLKINVFPFPDQNLYKIQIFFNYINIKKTQTLVLSVMNDGQIDI